MDLSICGRVLKHARKYGLRGSGHWLLSARVFRERDIIFPSFPDLLDCADQILCSPYAVSRALFSFEAKEEELLRIWNEYGPLRLKLEERYKEIDLSYPRTTALEESSSLLVYSIARIMKPTIIFETGVANGHSTYLLLHALLKNGRGQLYSTDISPNAGSLLANKDRINWRLMVIDTARKKSSFREAVNKVSQIDLFVHDSDHSYRWSKFEYETVLTKMASDSVMASDDVHGSYSFIDFAKGISAKPIFLIDKRKIFGILRLKGSSR
jgi:predicted O-methyltransferase YrrM